MEHCWCSFAVTFIPSYYTLHNNNLVRRLASVCIYGAHITYMSSAIPLVLALTHKANTETNTST